MDACKHKWPNQVCFTDCFVFLKDIGKKWTFGKKVKIPYVSQWLHVRTYDFEILAMVHTYRNIPYVLVYSGVHLAWLAVAAAPTHSPSCGFLTVLPQSVNNPSETINKLPLE